MKYKFNRNEIVSKVEETGCTVRILAKKIGVSADTLWNAMEGNTLPFDVYAKICEALNIEPNFDED